MKPPLLLAKNFEDANIDPTGWWMSEKLDGVRAYWNGKKFFSRLGNEYFSPDWFTEGFPPVPLDGELWAGRGKFQYTVSIARRQDKDDRWKDIKYVVFDCPSLTTPFEDRMTVCNDVLTLNQYSHVLHQEKCKGYDHLAQMLKEIESFGGEGVMLRQPKSMYIPKRSNTLLKVKSFQDTEGEIIEHLPGEGKHSGRLGALLLRLANGIEVSVGTGFSDWQRENPPAVGSTITFRYQGLTNDGVPRFPSYKGEKHD